MIETITNAVKEKTKHNFFNYCISNTLSLKSKDNFKTYRLNDVFSSNWVFLTEREKELFYDYTKQR